MINLIGIHARLFADSPAQNLSYHVNLNHLITLLVDIK